MKKLFVLSSLLLTLVSKQGFAQLKYYEDAFLGGVTAGGYSPAYNTGGTGSFSLNIAAGSTIRHAYLIAGRQGNAANITVTLNGINYTFDSGNQVSTTFQSPSYGGNSGVHVIDVTADINPAVNSYTLVVPAQTGPSNRYNDFSLYVAFNNAGMTQVNTAVFINTMNFSAAMNYTLNLTNAVNNTLPVGISVMSGFICDNATDGEKVSVNASLLGTIGNHDVNSGTCGGPLGSFVYSNNVLSGLSDDFGNLGMAAADALSDVKSKVTNSTTSIGLQFATVSAGNVTNAIWAVFVSYSSSTPLPVTLTEFSGRVNGNVNVLQWTTASEINCDYFDVERSHEGTSFNTFGTVQGSGNSNVINNYSLTDENPFAGTSYYRLKQMDYDGNYHYSSIVSLSNSNYTTYSVDVYTLQGQMIMTLKDMSDNYSLQNLTSGVYFLHYHTDKGLLIKKAVYRPNQEIVVMN